MLNMYFFSQQNLCVNVQGKDPHRKNFIEQSCAKFVFETFVINARKSQRGYFGAQYGAVGATNSIFSIFLFSPAGYSFLCPTDMSTHPQFSVSPIPLPSRLVTK